MALSRVENVPIRFTEHTIRRMHELIDRAVIDPKFQKLVYDIVNGSMRGQWKQYLEELDKVFRWYKSRVDYRRDPQGVELLQDVWATLDRRRADCDDSVIWLGAAARILGFPIRFVTVSQYTDRTPNHIYFQVQHKGKWIGVDATQHGRPLGWEPTVITDKRIWGRGDVGLSGLGGEGMSDNNDHELDNWFGEAGRNGTVGRPEKEAFYADLPDLPDSLEGMDDQVRFSGLGLAPMMPTDSTLVAQVARVMDYYSKAGSSTSRNLLKDMSNMTPQQRNMIEAQARRLAEAKARQGMAVAAGPRQTSASIPLWQQMLNAPRAGRLMGPTHSLRGDGMSGTQYPCLMGGMDGTLTDVAAIAGNIISQVQAGGGAANIGSLITTSVNAYRQQLALKDASAIAAARSAQEVAQIRAEQDARIAELKAEIARQQAGGFPGWVLPVAAGGLFLAFVAMQWRKGR